jgi:fatty-acyl-CoA synthase
LAERVDTLAAGFLALGLERGARIRGWSLNRPKWAVTQLAAANPAYRLSELEIDRVATSSLASVAPAPLNPQ